MLGLKLNHVSKRGHWSHLLVRAANISWLSLLWNYMDSIYLNNNCASLTSLRFALFAVATVPVTCADIVQLDNSATDGDYWLYPSGGPVRLYCHDMGGTPTGFISLVDPESNYGEDYNIGARTKFSRVAVNPEVGPQLMAWQPEMMTDDLK